MGPPVISLSLLYKERRPVPFWALLLFSFFLLSVSFFLGYPLLRCFFYIVDSIFSVFYCCSLLALFKVYQSVESLMRVTIMPRAGGRIFSDEHSVRGHRLAGHRNVSPSTSRNSFSGGLPEILFDSNASTTSPFDDMSSPLNRSPWSSHILDKDPPENKDGSRAKEGGLFPSNVLMGSLVREEGHIYSLAASGDLLYTGSDSKNIRVWRSQREFSCFKSNSGLVKAIVISGEKIFTGHQDGKIRVWKLSAKKSSGHKRVGTLPTFRDYIKGAMKRSSYVQIRRHKNTIWLKHFDAISCLSLSEDGTLLYSASWDKTIKVWRISDSKCLESITAHDDAVNSVVAGFDGLVFTGSADGTVKVWRRQLQGKGTKHFFSQTLLKQDCAVTALAVNPEATVVYCGSSDGLVNFWEREKHLSHGGVLRGHKLAVLCLVTAGNLVISGSADMGICVWKRIGSVHICLSLLTGHTGPVKCLAAEKDQELEVSGEKRWILYSGSLDKSVNMWRVSEQALPMEANIGDVCASAMPTFLPAASSLSVLGRLDDVKSLKD